jgi:hypothetical protein
MVDKNMSDEQLARQQIFGEKPPEPPAEPSEPADEPPAEPAEPPEEPIETPAEPTETPAEPGEPPTEPTEPPTEPPAPTEPAPIDIENLGDDKVLELINKKFNTNFDNIDSAKETLSEQIKRTGQEEIIKKLAEKVKESSNVLSHFPTEESYKVAQLAKEYPGKEIALAKIINSDIEKLTDFEALALAEGLKRTANSRVDPLRFKLHKIGLKEEDPADFENWEETDKEIVYGEAEDARESLKAIQSKIEVPKPDEDSSGVNEFIAEIERGAQAATDKQKELTDANQPVAESLVNGLTKIKPVEGSDFEYTVELDAESKKDLIEFAVAESIEGDYNIQSDADIRKLGGMVASEIWATDGPKITKAFGEKEFQRGVEETEKRFNNAEPLTDDVPPVDPTKKTEQSDQDRAQEILGGKR